jgi:hypothetical protein
MSLKSYVKGDKFSGKVTVVSNYLTVIVDEHGRRGGLPLIFRSKGSAPLKVGQSVENLVVFKVDVDGGIALCEQEVYDRLMQEKP